MPLICTGILTRYQQETMIVPIVLTFDGPNTSHAFLHNTLKEAIPLQTLSKRVNPADWTVNPHRHNITIQDQGLVFLVEKWQFLWKRGVFLTVANPSYSTTRNIT